MNEKIKQLALQAKQYAEDEQNNPLKIYTLDCFNEKFAQLIVRECAEWVKNTESNLIFGEEDAKALLEHFGVKE